jgi:hypothetical protein
LQIHTFPMACSLVRVFQSGSPGTQQPDHRHLQDKDRVRTDFVLGRASLSPLIVDALSVLGFKHIDTPCTPYRVWQAIANAGTCVTKPRTS